MDKIDISSKPSNIADSETKEDQKKLLILILGVIVAPVILIIISTLVVLMIVYVDSKVNQEDIELNQNLEELNLNEEENSSPQQTLNLLAKLKQTHGVKFEKGLDNVENGISRGNYVGEKGQFTIQIIGNQDLTFAAILFSMSEKPDLTTSESNQLISTILSPSNASVSQELEIKENLRNLTPYRIEIGNWEIEVIINQTLDLATLSVEKIGE
jgi:hypothetical protein